jgi:hypothetical protein
MNGMKHAPPTAMEDTNENTLNSSVMADMSLQTSQPRSQS